MVLRCYLVNSTNHLAKAGKLYQFVSQLKYLPPQLSLAFALLFGAETMRKQKLNIIVKDLVVWCDSVCLYWCDGIW